MLFVGVIEREDKVTVDGYSNRKTVNGAISDMGRYIAKHLSKLEGESLIEYKSEALLPRSQSCGGYYLEVEEVPSARNWNEETDEIEYKDANFYVCCCFVK